MTRSRLIVAILIIVIVIGGVSITALLITTLPDYQFVTYQSRDMEPTISLNETVLITKEVGEIQRADIIMFKYPADPSQQFIKRVVGLPGERVEIREGRVFIDQKLIEESYLDPKLNTWGRSISETLIPQGTYYVLGDNRNASNDSRYWGVLSGELISGRVMFK